jgi:hypothetical protein
MVLVVGSGVTHGTCAAHWCTLLVSGLVGERVRMHRWWPPGDRPARSTVEVRHEFCGARWSQTRRLATGLSANECRSVSEEIVPSRSAGASVRDVVTPVIVGANWYSNKYLYVNRRHRQDIRDVQGSGHVWNPTPRRPETTHRGR